MYYIYLICKLLYMVNFFYLSSNPRICAQSYCNKHVTKILVECCQLLCQVVSNNTKKKAPYKPTTNISKTLAPYKWINESKANYLYLLNLAEELLKEYKYRYENKEHKSEIVINWLKNNIPNHFKLTKPTKLYYTENIKLFNEYYNNDVICSRYIYVSYKCKTDNWKLRNKPLWFDKYQKNIDKYKNKYTKLLKINVYDKLPNIYRKVKDIKVKSFHCFLRICYDNMFGEKWQNYIKKYKKMYDTNKPLIHQLSFIHLKKAFEISNQLFNKNKLIELNNISLKYRHKL